MFHQLKNIDTAFKHIKAFSIIMIVACIVISLFALVKSYRATEAAQNRIYILANGKALEAFSAGRKDNIQVEAKDHVKTFHQYFFGLDPDDKVIQANVSKALYLADRSAKSQYDNLKENGYYSNLIAANISQEINVDSVELDINQYPYFFRCFATQKLIRATSTANRTLITEGFLRNVSRSDNNPHGFLIERWKTISNRDTTLQNQ
ncbi:Bacteroides conjugative transposon TraK protein [Daejeonella rubra]|uniref:Bacteroides conjugative transposon TraK protein n=1 Tax=Daejeonella rubra TaxID=990371 RepID=A0A1G9XLY1_9SPHI|nr:conjugative transposon protein TraK [Daejeonella rubra]SDM97750.1 Bacteroides conjugative transposon TraK protein [Daejeonella rubra]